MPLSMPVLWTAAARVEVADIVAPAAMTTACLGFAAWAHRRGTQPGLASAPTDGRHRQGLVPPPGLTRTSAFMHLRAGLHRCAGYFQVGTLPQRLRLASCALKPRSACRHSPS